MVSGMAKGVPSGKMPRAAVTAMRPASSSAGSSVERCGSPRLCSRAGLQRAAHQRLGVAVLLLEVLRPEEEPLRPEHPVAVAHALALPAHDVATREAGRPERHGGGDRAARARPASTVRQTLPVGSRSEAMRPRCVASGSKVTVFDALPPGAHGELVHADEVGAERRRRVLLQREEVGGVEGAGVLAAAGARRSPAGRRRRARGSCPAPPVTRDGDRRRRRAAPPQAASSAGGAGRRRESARRSGMAHSSSVS